MHNLPKFPGDEKKKVSGVLFDARCNVLRSNHLPLAYCSTRSAINCLRQSERLSHILDAIHHPIAPSLHPLSHLLRRTPAMVAARPPETPKSAPPPSPGPARLENLVGSLRNDPSLQVFLSETFSPSAHVGAAVRAQRVSVALEDAQRASSILSANVRQHVIRRKEALLAEVEAVDALEKEVTTVSTGVSSLVSATEALSDALDDPYLPMRAATRRLTNLAAVTQLVRGLQRFRHCTARLSDAGLFPTIGSANATTPASLPPAAEAARELEELIAPSTAPGLEKIEGVAKDMIAVRKANSEVRRRAATLLKSALADRNQTQVEAAILAFNALGVLQERVNGEVARLLRETQTAIHRGLEAPTSGRNFETDVWSAIENMLSIVADSCFKAILLQHVLSRKYDDVTHLSLLYDTLASSFIDSVSRSIAEQVVILARTRMQRPAAGQVFLTLAEGYPRLRGLLKDLAVRISGLVRLSPTPITKLESNSKVPLIPDHEFIEKALFSAVVEVETHYLNASLERLTKTVSSLFEGGKQPGEAEAVNVTKLLSQELNGAYGDKQLEGTAVSNVATALRLYTSLAEDHAAAMVPDEDDGKKDLSEVEEWHLTRMYNGMVSLHTSGSRVLGERDGTSGMMAKSIAKELGNLKRLSELLLDGPFSSCRSNVERVLGRMHTEDLSGEVGEDGCSVYVLDICAQLGMFADRIIPGLARSRCLGSYITSLAQWTLESFGRHALVVHAQDERVRVRLATDMARIETAVEGLCPARLLGRSYGGLRALRVGVLLPTSNLGDMDETVLKQVGDVGRGGVGHLILGRCSQGKLKMPHERLGLSAEEYVKWLEVNDEEEAWKAVEESVAEYRAGGGAGSGGEEGDEECCRAIEKVGEKMGAEMKGMLQ